MTVTIVLPNFGPPADCGDISPDPYYITCFSNHVEECNEIAAPGFDIIVGGFSGDGTSQATAHSSGAGALMFEKNACGSLTPYEARATIYNTAWDFWFAYPYCVFPPPPRHINTLPAVNAVSAGGCGTVGDLDCDSTVSAADFASFVDCMTGPNGGPVVGFCRCGDAPSSPPDGDVDLRDLQAFQLAFTGPGVGACCHPNGNCTDGPVPDCIAVFGARYQGHNTTCARTACPSPNLGACCDAAAGTCEEDVGEADCSFGGGTYQGDGTTCAATCPTIRYRNVIDPLTTFTNSGAGMALADDVTLSGSGTCELAFYDLAVFGGGGGTFDVTAGIYTNCPGNGGTLIPGTEVTWTGNPDNGSPVFLDASLDVPVTIPNTGWLVVEFSTPQAGWFIAEQAEVGFTANLFGVNQPPWGCNFWFGGDPYAGFWANLGCVE